MIPDPASTSQQRSPSSPPTKHKSPNTLISISKPTTILCNVKNSSLWISGMRDPYIDVCKEDESAYDLTSGFSLSVLASTWRLRASYSSLVELSEASVIGEDSGSFHCLSTSRNDTVICHFPLNAPWQCIQVRCNAPSQCTWVLCNGASQWSS